MTQAIRKKAAPAFYLAGPVLRHLKEGGVLALVALAVFMFTALISYHPADPGWTHTGREEAILNRGGIVGAWFADIAFHLFGYLGYLLPASVAYTAWLIFRGLNNHGAADYVHGLTRFVGLLLLMTVGCGLIWIHVDAAGGFPSHGAGFVGNVVGKVAAEIFGSLGATVLMLAMLLTGVTLLTGLSWFWLMDTVGIGMLCILAVGRRAAAAVTDRASGLRARKAREAIYEEQVIKIAERPKPRIEPPQPPPLATPPLAKERQTSFFDAPNTHLPPIALLDPPPPPKGGFSAETLTAMSRQVELKLLDFGIEVSVVAVHPGPVITRFELQPAPGMKAARVTSLSRDLARSLSTVSVRVVEVIPGKSVIGLEIPNHQRELVSLREILSSQEYEANQSALTLALGKDIGGKPVIVDLGRMPHLLVAGTTGAGKSVALNAMILSLLYKAPAKDVRLIMIDPKMLELSVYEGIPSLLAPVVTDMKEAANALRWSVAEMERRYRLMATLGVRNLSGYNRKVQEAIDAGNPLPNPFFGDNSDQETLGALPNIVVIVDELADMMMTVGKKVEELIARLAQKARASGIHLILATQRPSVDVITGLIKANIPSRIAFQVSSRIDSRTIIDQMGAESLLGHGDMLYLPPGTGVPIRVHGAFVSDQEVHKVVAHLKQSGTPDYVGDILRGDDAAGDDEFSGAVEAGSDVDELYDEAVRFVTDTRRASVSGVQRRLKVGYNRAARMIEEMERSGVVGALQSNGFRDVLAPPPPKD
ncbi:MAG: DNA translocase FtsK [Gammaproteobacteria bacterium]